MSTKAEIQQRFVHDPHVGRIIQIENEFFILDLFEVLRTPLSLCMQVESDQLAYFEAWEERRDFRTVSWADGAALHQMLLVRPSEVNRRRQKVVLRAGSYKEGL